MSEERKHRFGSIEFTGEEGPHPGYFELERITYSLDEELPSDHPFDALRELGFEQVEICGAIDGDSPDLWVVAIASLKWPDAPFIKSEAHGQPLQDAHIRLVVDENRWIQVTEGASDGEEIKHPPIFESTWLVLEALRDNLNCSYEPPAA